MRNFFYTMLMAMVPVVELRGAIPLGAGLGLGPMENYICCVVGNMLPIPFILLFVRTIVNGMKKYPVFHRFVAMIEGKVEKNKDKIIRYELWGLLIFVAIPLPGTGAWTGALVAAFLDLRLRKAIPAILGGVLIAGLIVSAVTYGAIHVIF